MHRIVDRALEMSRADHCIVIGARDGSVNLRWANNTATTNGVGDAEGVTVVSVIGRRVGTAARTWVPPDAIESLVRESEAACESAPEAPDFFPLVEGGPTPNDWTESSPETSPSIVSGLAVELAEVFARARSAGLSTFGYAEHETTTLWLGTSAGLRRRHVHRAGKVELTAKTPDYGRSAWAGCASASFSDVNLHEMFDRTSLRIAWSDRARELPAGRYEVLLESSAVADMALEAYWAAAARDADEGRSVFSRPGGGNRIGERLCADRVTIYSDPEEPGIETWPFVIAGASGSHQSVFDNGLPAARTEWVRDGVLRALVAPRAWAARTNAPARPFISNIVLPSDGPTLEEMIATTQRGLLVTCLWYIRTVDPQTLLKTGLTRDGVFLIEDGEIAGAVNNFRFNMSPVQMFAQAIEMGRSGMALSRENDEFLLAKAPPARIADFNMSSVSRAT